MIPPARAWRILTKPELDELLSTGRFTGSALDRADGFIHLSAPEQVTGTLDTHFAGVEGLHLAAIDLALLGDKVRWEASRGGALFPHLYGDLALEAVPAHGPVVRNPDGSVSFPD